MSKVSDCCGAEIKWSGIVGKGNQNACSKCDKPCGVKSETEESKRE